MKVYGKRLLAAVAALAVSCSMVTGWAANTAEITKVEVLSDSENVVKEYETLTDVKLNPSQLMRVTVKLKDADSAAAVGSDATFLSNLKGAASLDNSSIQYVDQVTVDDTGVATITFFRPRATLGTNGIGDFEAKAGGTDVAVAKTFDYSVVSAIQTMKITAITNSLTLGTGLTDATFKVEDFTGTALTVKKGTEEVTAATYAGGTLTIPASYFTAAGSYEFTVSAEGYNDVAITVIVKEAPSPSITPEQEEGAQNALNDQVLAPQNDVVTLPDKIDIGGGTKADVTYDVNTKNDSALSYDAASGTITYNSAAAGKPFVSKATVTSSISAEGGKTISSTQTVYFVPDGTTISYGNITAIAAADGTDAYDDQTSFAAVPTTDKLAAKAEALNIVLGRDKLESVAQPTETLDYDKDGKFVLAEYRILKLMIAGATGYDVETVKNSRASWVK